MQRYISFVFGHATTINPMEVDALVENKVREYREKLGWSQDQLAEKSGVGRSTISEVETGRHIVSLEAALRLARALNAPVEQLFRVVD